MPSFLGQQHCQPATLGLSPSSQSWICCLRLLLSLCRLTPTGCWWVGVDELKNVWICGCRNRIPGDLALPVAPFVQEEEANGLCEATWQGGRRYGWDGISACIHRLVLMNFRSA